MEGITKLRSTPQGDPHAPHVVERALTLEELIQRLRSGEGFDGNETFDIAITVEITVKKARRHGSKIS